MWAASILKSLAGSRSRRLRRLRVEPLEGRCLPSGFSTYLGGSQDDNGYGIAVDSAGDTFIIAATDSPDFPHTVGSYSAGYDIAVTKLAPDGSVLWCALYGGSGDEFPGFDVSVDAAGDAYLTGVTNSADFPTTPGAFDRTLHGTVDNAFVMKVDGATGDLVYSTYLAGTTSAYNSAIDDGYSIAIDAAGDAYVAGETVDTDFPGTAGAFQSTFGGGANDAFLAELNADGSGLVYATYLGGGNYDNGIAIAVDTAGDAYVSGETLSTDFPTTAGAFQTASLGSEAVFVAKLTPGGTALDYSTYISGSDGGSASAAGLAIDAAGAAYVTGYTTSADFPTTAGAFQQIANVSDETFVTKLDPTGGSLDYSTFLGGSGQDDANGLAVDDSGHAFVTGFTASADFPTTADALATTLGGPQDAFVTELNPAGSALTYSTYLGGGAYDDGYAVGLDAAGSVYLTGYTNSTDFPTSAGAYQPASGGGNDVFVTQLLTGVAAATVTINQAAGQADPTNSAPITFDVDFSVPVTGFNASGIDLSASTAAGSLQANVSGSGSHYSVTVTGMNGPGTVVAKVRAGAALDPSSDPTPASTSTDDTVTFDNAPPTVTIAQALTQADPTDSNPVIFDFQFNEPVVGFNASKVSLGGTLAGYATVGTISNGPNPYEYMVDVNIAAGHSGTITGSMAAGSVTDTANNPLGTPTIDDNTVTFDQVPPTVTVALTAGQGSTSGGSQVSFVVSFDEPIQSFTPADLDFTAPTAATPAITGPAAGTNDYTVTFTGMSVGGPISLTIDPDAVQDLADNGNLASNSASVTYVHSGSLLFHNASYTASAQGGATLTVTVDRVGGQDGVLTADFGTVDGTGPTAAKDGTDYSAVNGTLSWDDQDPGSKVISIPLRDFDELANGFKPDATFSVSLSNINLSGALGLPPVTTRTVPVTLIEQAGIQFTQAKFDTSENVPTGMAAVTVQRLFDTTGIVTVSYTTSDGSATTGSDYTTANGTLTWSDGDGADKTILVPINNDNLNEGKETIHLSLSGVNGNAILGPQATAILTIAASDGITINGLDKKPSSTFTDVDGDLVTVTLRGKQGSLTYYLTNGVNGPPTKSNGPLAEIDLTGTDATKSTVTITVKKPKTGAGDARVQIGEIDGTGFKSFASKAGDLIGTGFALGGYAGSITVGNVTNGADFELTGVPPPKAKGTKIVAGVIADGTDVNVTASLTGLTAIAVGKGTIEAPAVGAITIKGQKANSAKGLLAINGDFNSDVTITGVGVDTVKGKALKSLSVAGVVNNAVLTIHGNVGTVSVGSFDTSDLFVGYIGPVDGSGIFNANPFALATFTTKATAHSFGDSYVIATAIKSVSLASVDTTNVASPGTKFGFGFRQTTVNGKAFGGVARLSAKDNSGNKLSYNAKTGGTQPLEDDFQVTKL